MTEKLRTLVIFCEDRFRKECRHQLGKIDCAKVVLEISHQTDFVTDTWEEITGLEPHVVFLELNKSRDASLHLLKGLQQNFPSIPILAAGELCDSSFLIEALRLGVKEIIPRPLNPNALHEALSKIHRHAFQSTAAKEPAKIFSFFGCKGGSGSTTIATNFAVSLSKVSKKKTLVLDLALGLGDVASFFGVKNNRFLVQEGSENSVLDSRLVSSTIVTHAKTGIDLLSYTDGFLRKTSDLSGKIKPLLELLQKEYDYIILDASSTLNNLVVSALDLSHVIFLISKCNLPTLRNSQRVLHGFERLGYSSTRIRLVINRYSKIKDVSVKDIERTLSFKVFWSIPNDYRSLIRSIQSGDPLTLQTDSIPLARSFYDMSAEVLGIKVPAPPDSPDGGRSVKTRDTAKKQLPLTTLNLLKS